MNVLLLGSGGREHALGWKLAQSPSLDSLYAAPGNPGLAEIATLVALKLEDHRSVVDFCFRNSIELVVIGPEAPLVDGMADNLRAVGIAVFGPGKAAARLEGSKTFTKKLCEKAGIPTAKFRHARAIGSALRALKAFDLPVVIKADGLAAGKGVTIAETEEAAIAAIEEIFDGRFGKKGAAVVIEEFMIGEEASLFALTDGKHLIAFGTAQDHKRAFDGDQGPNTGGMGAYSPAPVMTDAITRKTMEDIIKPTMAEMVRRGVPFQGVLFAGLMIDDGQPRLIEYNVRFGDPECQCLMLRLGAQALDLMLATAEGRLGEVAVTFADDHAMSVVMAAENYPGAYEKGSVINGLEDMPETSFEICFHAGTTREAGRFVATGGRVLALTARGDSLRDARDKAYGLVDRVDWPQGFCRHDIGWRALPD